VQDGDRIEIDIPARIIPTSPSTKPNWRDGAKRWKPGGAEAWKPAKRPPKGQRPR